jgi:hypothetical protein
MSTGISFPEPRRFVMRQPKAHTWPHALSRNERYTIQQPDDPHSCRECHC